MKKHYPKTEDELAKRFSVGEDPETLGFDISKAYAEHPKIKRIHVDFPEHVLAKIDREANLIGINRQALIKMWINDRMEQRK